LKASMKVRGVVFVCLLVLSGIPPMVSLVMGQGTPWEDDDFDGVPNYLDRAEFVVQWAEDIGTIEGTTWQVKAFLVRPSGIGDFNLAVGGLGVDQALQYDLTQVGVIELTSLSLPNIIPDFLYWMAGYNLVDSTLIPEATPMIQHLVSSDGKFRIMPVLQYKVDTTYPTMRTSMYLLNGTGPPGALRVDSATVLTPSFFTKSDGEDKGEKGILDLLEEIWDFLTGGANLGSLAEVLLKKALDWLIDEIKQALQEKNWFKKIAKIVKAVAKKLPWLKFIGIIKEILSKFHILELPWWFPDPPEGVLSPQRIDLHLYDPTGNHLLGIDYATGTTISGSPQGLYFGGWPYHQLMLISTDSLPYRLGVTSKGPEPLSQYEVFLDDPNPGELNIVHFGGALAADESRSGMVYVGIDDNYAVSGTVTTMTVSNFYPAQGEIIMISATVTDESGGSIPDAVLTARTTNGTNTNYYPFLNQGGGSYTAMVNVSELYGNLYAGINTDRPPNLPDEHEFALIVDLKRYFEMEWSDYDNDGLIGILDIAQAAFVFDQPSFYWDLNLNGRTDIVEIATVAFFFDRSFGLPGTYPGELSLPGQMDPGWSGAFCDNLPEPPRTYCVTRI